MKPRSAVPLERQCETTKVGERRGSNEIIGILRGNITTPRHDPHSVILADIHFISAWFRGEGQYNLDASYWRNVHCI